MTDDKVVLVLPGRVLGLCARSRMACSALAWLPLALWAQSDAPSALPVPPRELSPVVVTATRTDALAFDVPAAIDRIDSEELGKARALVNISENLGGVPGLLARDRQNYAQDVQISVRGFGARSTFGIRGVRLYVDGIPATLPDGQGQISHVELGSVGRIEVLRGPYSALYGNSSGGVIQVFTADGDGAPSLKFDVSGGNDGALRLGTVASATQGGVTYVASASRFRTDGYRDHSATERTLANIKLVLRPGDDSKLTLIANALSLPRAQDPLGLSRAQFEANPRGVDASALAFDTRKTVDQTQVGLVYERRIDPANTLALTTYYGHRRTEQFQSIPVVTQANPLHPGGVIALGRDYRGVDLRWTFKTVLRDAPLTLVSGLAWDDLGEHRQGYRNSVGATLGVQGALRRDEHNDVASADQYLQANWQVTPRWLLNAGVRHSNIRFRSADTYVVGPNPDDSGRAAYSATLPVLGAMFALDRDLHVYAAAGRGFETPTLNELAYRPGGATGLNLGLRAARSTSLEAGVKSRAAASGEWTVALFQTRTSNEIVTQTNLGGRSTFQNAGATLRTGFELGWSQYFAQNLRAQVAYTLLNATYRDAFSTCATVPCAVPGLVIPSGNLIPGVARTSLFAAFNWMPPTGWRAGAELRQVGRVHVNDANSDAATSYTVVAANLGYSLQAGRWELGSFIRVDNLFARRYAGSVIVNQVNGRYFEPAPARTWLAGANATLAF